jgi:CHAD domain-containing protein
VRHLQSKKYATIMTDWEAFLASPPTPAASATQAPRPIFRVARKRIRKKCRAVVKLGAQLLKHPDDQRLHQLRIECKKLRYLLEFFSSLFASDDISPVIKALRRLQDNLGEFHDACVQQESLHTFANDWRSTTPANRRTLQAIDSLIGRLEGDKQTLVEAFSGLFSNFAASTSDVSL